MEQVAPRSIKPGQCIYPFIRETVVMTELLVFVQQPVYVTLALVLKYVVSTVQKPIRITEAVPIIVLKWTPITVFQVPSAHRYFGVQLEGSVRIDRSPM